MDNDQLVVAVNKLRLHIKSDPDLSEKFGQLIDEACKRAGIAMPAEFYEGLIIVHHAEVDSEFSVVILPVGSQCGL
ncbi:hypothetical protein ACFFJT_13000 [Dyella flava]|uniref:Uncharacterized protein n=1 Tax=Dyella flava TaxID=1920170 RepID=A0ABS2K1D4_9GAMM|nr:hypothetical protein [Dyella flava]MBM7124420.1 hypothetical protein [Dyella flava]GLQ52508.1 hypothetical protein GCM10010872_39570 [Dyella flava]